MDAQMKYEYIIRMAHGCPRYGVPEANALVYDNYDDNNLNFEQGLRLGKIVTSIRYAVDKVLKEHSSTLPENLKEELEELSDEGLMNTAKIDLNTTVSRILEIFQSINLRPGV